MRKATLDKINDIKKMQQEGKTDIEIVREKFGRNWKKYHEFMGKHELLEVAPQFKKQEPPYSPYNIEIAKDAPTLNKMPLQNSPVQVLAPEELGKLRQLIDSSDDLLALLQKPSDDIEEIQILEVPEDLVKIGDLRVRSVRLSESIEREFDDLVKDNKLYSKTSLVNLALQEFIQKYR